MVMSAFLSSVSLELMLVSIYIGEDRWRALLPLWFHIALLTSKLYFRATIMTPMIFASQDDLYIGGTSTRSTGVGGVDLSHPPRHSSTLAVCINLTEPTVSIY